MTTAQNPTAPGYICKTCGAPTPLGIGYTSTDPGAHAASEALTTNKITEGCH